MKFRGLFRLGVWGLCAVVSFLLFRYSGPVTGLWVSVPVALVLAWFSGAQNHALAMAGGAMLGLAWPAIGNFTPFLFIAFVPLLFAEDRIAKANRPKSGGKVFRNAYLFFFVFNAVSTYWIYYASFLGVTMSLVLISLFMALIWRIFHGTRRTLGKRVGYWSLLIYWLAFEHIHLHWDFSFPWLHLGNGFANVPFMIQWYEFTGVAGGTAWIIASNILIYKAIKTWLNRKEANRKSWSGAWPVLVLIVVPVVVSLVLYNGFEEKGKAVEVVAVQPNIDPYNDKFSGNPFQHLKAMLELADAKWDTTVDLIAFPETALQEPAFCRKRDGQLECIGLWESKLNNSKSVQRLRAFQARHPKAALLVGMSHKKRYRPGDIITETARPMGDGNYYDAYNSSLFMEEGQEPEVYYKSQPLIGVEKMPLTWLLKPLEKFIWDMGGTTGSLGVQEDREVHHQERTGAKYAPVICYESVFGDYVGEYVRNGANLLCILTNDGWWGNTPGYHQHCMYASLRAIEHRRSLVRSANTGTSCFLDQRGEITQPTDWWVPDAIKGTVQLNEEKTFYTLHGDFIGRVSVFIAVLLWLWTLVVSIKTRFDPLSG